MEKALDVINFDVSPKMLSVEGTKVIVDESCDKIVFWANKYFACERYDAGCIFSEKCVGSRALFLYILKVMEANRLKI
ncbi:MAG TPA: hypothetical protein VHP38_14405 [Ruminiclostridium sp.]|nr:hypothetical protein [Ruminiclostridium sp.]